MGKYYAKFILFCFMVSFLMACSGNSTAVTKPSPFQANPSPTAAGAYPVPETNQTAPTTAPGAQATGYPAPSQPVPTIQEKPKESYPPQESGILITFPSGSKQTLSTSILNSLPPINANLEGKENVYRKLSEVIGKAGSESFAKAIVTGQAGATQLTKDQVNRAYLEIQLDGKIRILVEGMPAGQWPVNVIAITLQ